MENELKIGNWKTFVLEKMRGDGLEVGAFFNPFDYNKQTTKMIYADRYSREELINLYKHNPEVKIDKIVDANVIYNVHQDLWGKDVFDFICASHVFEHLYNPVKVLVHWFNAIKENGYIFLVIPDKEHTFDKPREVTTVDHLINDYKNDVKEADLDHYKDFYSNVYPHEPEEKVKKHYLSKQDFHCHVFTRESILELFISLSILLDDINFKIIDIEQDGMNISILLKKVGKNERASI